VRKGFDLLLTFVSSLKIIKEWKKKRRKDQKRRWNGTKKRGRP
jgi:hypothetical protein